MAVRFLAVGELLVDVIAAGAGHGARIRVLPAGSAFNAAVAAAAAGADAAVIGTVGDDAAGRMIVRELEAHGVRPIVSRVEGVTGTFLLADGEIRVDRGDSHRLGIVEPVAADAVLVSGYLPHAADVLATAEGTWVALDAARLTALPPGGNAVIANEETARRLTGRDGEPAVRALAQRYRLACVTRGEDGTIAILDGRLEAARDDPVDADALGAGDAFAATLLVDLARGEDLGRALRDGCRAARTAIADRR
jgi:ribokinase